MFCVNCGAENPDGAQFCTKCGQPTGSATGNSRSSVATAAKNAVGGVADFLNEVTGGEGHVELRFKDFFTNVPKRHTKEETRELFACGSPSTTPKIQDVSTEWPKPWLYSRVFAVLLVTFMGCVILWEGFQNPNAFPNLMFIGALMVPFSVLVFFYETNVPRNISIAQVVEMFFVGGVASILAIYPVSALLPEGGVGNVGAAMITGIIEEVAKILIVAFFMSRTKGRNYILNGLLIGAAVGAGFAVFESAGYAFNSFMENYELGISAMLRSDGNISMNDVYAYGYAGVTSITALRATLAIGGHVVWAAAEGAAMAICEAGDGFKWKQLIDIRFLIVSVICVVLHGIWDTYPIPFLSTIEIPLFGDLRYVLLIIAIWVVIVVMLNRGLAQINELSSGQGQPSGASSVSVESLDDSR